MLLPDADEEKAYAVAEEIRNRIAHQAFDEVGNITISLGTAAFDGTDDIKNLYLRLDAALYKAKELGRNRVEKAEK